MAPLAAALGPTQTQLLCATCNPPQDPPRLTRACTLVCKHLVVSPQQTLFLPHTTSQCLVACFEGSYLTHAVRISVQVQLLLLAQVKVLPQLSHRPTVNSTAHLPTVPKK